MLCLMHESVRRGFLQMPTGVPVTAAQIARMSGCATDETAGLLRELSDAGVYSCTENGVIYSRRMAREENKRSLCSAAGKKGGGNPTFIGHFKGAPKGLSKGPPEKEDEDSSLGSSPFSGGGLGEPRIRAPMTNQWPQLTLTAIRAAYPVQSKGKATLLAIDRALCRLAGIGVPDGPRWLRGRVEAFSKTVAGQPRQYLPHPPKWFDDERYNDDDSAWKRDGDGPTLELGKGGF